MTEGYTPDGYSFTAKYDAEDRLSSIEYTDGNSIIHKWVYTYRWDNFLGRIQQYENSVLTGDIHIVRGESLALQDRDASNNIIRGYVWGQNLGGGIGGLLSLRQNGSEYSYLFDGKGNVTTVLDNSQAIVASYSYNAFGRLMSNSGTLDQPFQFSTKRYDFGTGLNYYGYRFYNPAIERWMNRDPLGEAGGINLYGFVRNDPVNFIDPDGKVPTVVGGAVAGGIVGGLAGAISSAIGTAVSGGSVSAIAQSVIVGGITGAAVGTVVGGMAGAGIIGPMGLAAGDFAAGFNVALGAEAGPIAAFLGGLLGQAGSVITDPTPAFGEDGEKCD